MDTPMALPRGCSLGRLAVVDDNILEGSIGKIKSKRLLRLKRKLADWLTNKTV